MQIEAKEQKAKLKIWGYCGRTIFISLLYCGTSDPLIWMVQSIGKHIHYIQCIYDLNKFIGVLLYMYYKSSDCSIR